MTPAERITPILERQNRDGGWGWNAGGSSWVEPTAYALLAVPPEARKAGVSWLLQQQLADGGWRPHPTVAQSTAVTALACLVPEMKAHRQSWDRGIDWLLSIRAKGATLTQKVLRPVFGLASDQPLEYPAWPFVPGTAPWVIPTSLAIMTLTEASSVRRDVIPRLNEARAFLQARACSDGGWNYGTNRILGVEAASYPETTGIALAALAGLDTEVTRRAVTRAKRWLAECPSSEGASWLAIALARHKRPQALMCAESRHPQTTVELALRALAEAQA